MIDRPGYYKGLAEFGKHRQPARRVERLSMAEIKAVRRDREAYYEYIRRFQAGDESAARVLLQLNHGAIHRVAQRYGRNRHRDYGDILQTARIGLLEAMSRFDFTRNIHPLTYAYHYIRGYVSRDLMDSGDVVRLPIHEYRTNSHRSLGRKHTFCFSELAHEKTQEMEHSFEETLIDEDPLADEVLTTEELRQMIPEIAETLLKSLPPRVVDIMRKRFTEDGGETLQSLGDSLGVSRERARQLLADYGRKLRRATGEPGISFDDWLAGIVEQIKRAAEEIDTP